MGSAHSRADPQPGAAVAPVHRVKILVAGPFGVGKTSLIGSVSEVAPVSTEERITQASEGVDDLVGIGAKTATTVTLDFGRLSLGDGIVLYLFGTPGQERFRPLWQDLAVGAWGALVLVDVRRLEASFDALALIEDLGLPHAVAVNAFPDSPRHSEGALRGALDLEDHTPLVVCDARETDSCVDALLALIHLLISRAAL
ncbi:GTP-binding protein [Streptomyces sp. NPDC092296]|uniref:GTP-binding protein n=1 Tax=Streptomyces sp. NPDC092296 TaxID=3366012 RepID=UPI003808AF69